MRHARVPEPPPFVTWLRRAAPTLAWIGLWLAVVLGVVARFVTTSALWLDEALSVNIASLPLDEIPEALRHDGHPPLYYWLLHGWMSAVGEGDVAVRALSGLLAVASLPLAWIAGKETGGTRVAVASLLMVSLSPYAIRYATEARMYSLVMVLVLIGWIALLRVLRGAGLGWAIGLAVVAGLLLWTHYWSIYLLATAGGVLLWRIRRQPEDRPASIRAFVALAAGSLTFLPWVPSLLEQAAHTGTPWAEPARPTQVFVDTLDALGGGAFPEARSYGVFITIAVVIAVCTAVSTDGRLTLTGTVVPERRTLAIVVAGTAAIGSAVGLLSGSAFNPRYAAVIVPMILVLAAVGLSRPAAAGLTRTVAAVLLLLALAGIGYNATWSRTQSDEHAAQILAQRGADDVVVVCPDQLGPSLERELATGDGPVPIPYPTAGDPRFVDWRDYAERNAAADPATFASEVRAQADGAPIWIVWNGSYKTYEGQCEALARELGRDRRLTVQVTIDENAYEPSLLWRFE